MQDLTGKTAKGNEYTLSVDTTRSGDSRYYLTMPSCDLSSADAAEKTVQGMQVIQTTRAHKVKGHGSVAPAVIITPEIREWINAAEAAKQAAAAQAEDDIRSGRVPVTVTYHDGEYLSGYTCHGLQAKLLVALGVAKHVEGWGVHVDGKLVAALGQTFAYADAAAYAAPAIAAKAAKTAEATAAREAIFAEAARTGKRQELSRHMDECDGSVVDCSYDSVVIYAMPDGSERTVRTHTF